MSRSHTGPPASPGPGHQAPAPGAGPRNVSLLDGLALVAWMFVGQILLYGIALELGIVGQGDATLDRFVQVSVMSAVLASTLAWLGLRGRLGDALAFGRRARALDLAVGVGAGVAGFVVLLIGLGLLFQSLGLGEPEQQALDDAATGGIDALLAVALAVVLAPLLEELVFRGAFYRSLSRHVGMWPAALISSGVFTVVHIEIVTSAPHYLLQLFLLGLVFAWLYERTGNLLAPVAAHLVFNGISITLAILAGRYEQLDELAAHLRLLG